MNKISILKEAAIQVGCNNFLEELSRLENRLSESNTPMMIPLVGEFSSGKTTLINSLLDSKALETATKPTTASIFEIHFGADANRAEVLRDNGQVEKVDDIKSLTNDVLGDATVITVFDKSTLVSPYTILVDTPGISSPDPKHVQTLVNFLPQADSLLVVVDINQQLTKSLTDFLKSVSLTGIEMNVVLTKGDTKSDKEIEAAKKYFIENCELNINKIVVVSASKNDTKELVLLLEDIEKRKAQIIKKSTENRIEIIAKQLLDAIRIMLDASHNNKALENEIQEQQARLKSIERQIDKFVNGVQNEIEDITRNSSRRFEDEVSTRLSALINTKSQNYDAEAVGMINSLATIVIGEYRQSVMKIISNEISNAPKTGEISLSCVSGIDLSELGVRGLPYDMDLNSCGHEYDGWIKTGVIAVGALAAAGAIAATGGVAAAAEGAMAADTLIDIADTASDIGSMVSNRNMTKKLEKVVNFGGQAVEKYATIDNVNTSGISGTQAGKGMIDSLAGFIAEKTMSKPQRARAIRSYIDGSLAPEFKRQLKDAEMQVVDTVKNVLTEAATASIDEITSALQNMQAQEKADKAAFEKKKQELRELETKLLTL
ncbi:MAG: dynamin family protein [Duncaniella sp.]|nr:dynamin family protein [Duncaniella sp.]